MRFQSKYRNYQLMFRPSRWGYNPDQTRTLVQGITITFSGPQRIFDSVEAERLGNWDEGVRDQVEDYILKNKKYGNDIYLAPGQDLPEDKQAVARIKPEEVRRFCRDIFFEDGELQQCKDEPAVGRDYCAKHDPDQTRIVKGLATSTD